MIASEQDLDVVRWGLQLFESDPYANYVYGNTTLQNHPDYYHHHRDVDGDQRFAHFKEGGFGAECFAVEHDELIVHSLQEELSQLAVRDWHGGEESECTRGWLDRQIVETDCCGPAEDGEECGKREEEGDVEPSSSCSSPLQESCEGQQEWPYSLEVMDEYAFDSKWLNEMVPIPHVPRINGEIPSVDEATLDYQRLLDRLQVYDLVERKVQGDGNCQFRALSDQFYRTFEHHDFVRQQVVNQLKSYREIYEEYVPMAYDEYLEKMSRSGEWGDHVTLQAAADLYGVKIIVITSFKDTCYIEILPSIQRSNRVILLSFWAEVHYNSIFPRD